MNTSSTNSVYASQGTQSTSKSTTDQASGFGSDDFMLMLLAQLRNQNPLEPIQDKDLMNQVTQLNSLQELQKINTGIQELYKANQLTEAAGLIGKLVEVKGADDKVISGTVTGVSLVKGEVTLWLGDKSASISDLITVKGATPSAPAGD